MTGIKIDGRAIRVHSQGVFVTDTHFFVTGRLETSPPRALLLRIDRSDSTKVEHLDITFSRRGSSQKIQRLDHPGGFDCDGKQLWIPVSVSEPRSLTVVIRVPLDGDGAFCERPHDVAFEVDDHIGALAVDAKSNRLYGANWDTRLIYVWELDGVCVRKIAHDRLIKDHPDWNLAVQDWKYIGGGLTLASGTDKSNLTAKTTSRAVVDLLDLDRGICLCRNRFARRPESDHYVTREGMAFRGDRLFLLPGDIVPVDKPSGKQGSRVTVFCYRLPIGAGAK
ncbi:MAG: hypothetical protein JXM70_25250 [Pirellulales bacterium]|nr:hypothetical protein [Pirellulales bacterium]